MNKNSKIYVAGHLGLVGSSILRQLKNNDYKTVFFKKRSELDLTNYDLVCNFFSSTRPEYVFLAAAKVGGIGYNNSHRADFILENLLIQNNVIRACYKYGVKKLLFLGSSCIYPKNTKQPILESSLLTGELEFTNEPYALAKIAGIKMCESFNIQYGTNFISVMPTNLYGINDNYNLKNSHVLPAILRKVHLAKLFEDGQWDKLMDDIKYFNTNPDLKLENKSDIISFLNSNGIKKNKEVVEVEIWGTGKPKREFLYSDDMASACIHIMKKFDFYDLVDNPKEPKNSHINIGTSTDISITMLANKIKRLVKFSGVFYFNSLRPDGTMRKVLNTDKLNKLGWKFTIGLDEGLEKVYKSYKDNFDHEF